VTPLQGLIKSQQDGYKKLVADGRRLEKEIRLAAEKHAKAKQKYRRSCKEAEILNTQYGNSSGHALERRAKIVNRLATVKREMDDNARTYKQAVDILNQMKERFNTGMSSVLSDLESQEAER
jgi:hypothetical protein